MYTLQAFINEVNRARRQMFMPQLKVILSVVFAAA